MLEEQDIRAFVYGTTHYFEVAAQQAASVGSPFLVTQGRPEIHDYTGVIGVSGRRSGVVCFSAPRGMLTVLLMKMNESNVTHENLCDLVGEVANTISGNVRRDFGRDFAISAPTILTGNGARIDVPGGCRPVVIPINWRSHAAKLVVCLQ
ncbi:MAG TPA: chemotaxis protein CheX [Steroidobacteraceae bacterium]|nr:chemotaxis protein CheX [Steroidobacteraceae bacterium]